MERGESSVPGYARGFVVACRASYWAKEVIHEPAWWTVRELVGRIDHPVMYALRKLRGVDVEDVAQLCAGGTLALESLEVSLTHGSGHARLVAGIGQLATILRETTSLPRLRDLGFERFNSGEQPAPNEVTVLFATPLGARLETLRCPTGCESIAAWITQINTARPPSLQTLDLTEHSFDPLWELRLTRDSDGRFSSLTAHCPRRPMPRWALTDDLLPALESLPLDALTALTVSWDRFRRPQKEDLQRLRALPERLTRTICTLP